MERSTKAQTMLGDLHRATPWLWLYCATCPHHAPLACAIPVIRWGAGTSRDKLRQCARCTACGHKGATIQHPGWGGADIGFLPFPVVIPARKPRRRQLSHRVPREGPALTQPWPWIRFQCRLLGI
jgi:hypothetical protein